MSKGIRPLYWSVRRELWENRSIVMAPTMVASLMLFGFLISMFTLPSRMRAVMVAATEAKQRNLVAMPHNVISVLLLVTTFIIAVFYCLDAFQSERADRSILFWKSLPVSDRTTVFAKALIPLCVLPAIVFVLTVIAQTIVLLASTVVLLSNPTGLRILWKYAYVFQSAFALLYGVIVIVAWHAPIYAWLLLVSAWARRNAVLWAMLPIFALGVLERMFLRTTVIGELAQSRMIGWFTEAFSFQPKGSVSALAPFHYLTPVKYLSSPGLWLGLLCAALFLAGAVRLRRNREPM